MPGLDLSGFVSPAQTFEGINRAADLVVAQSEKNQRLKEQREAKSAATSKFLTDYLDPKDKLTGTNYDPVIVNQLQGALQQGVELAGKGASTSDILMALGPSVNKINDYSTKAKLINQQIKDSVGRLKGYAGYNTDALESEAKKQAFYGPDGKLKDISTIDPNQNYVAMAAQNSPDVVTTGKGLDDFVNKTPMADYSRNVTTTYAGRSKNSKIEAKHPFWEDLQRDDKGNLQTDDTGAPLGLGVVGSPMVDDKNKPIVNPETGKPFMAMDKNYFNAIMTHNPDVADYIRGQVNTHFKQAGAKELPAEGSPQWDMMARHILGDELQTRSRSSFRTLDQQKETAQAVKVELAQDPAALDAIARFNAAQKLKGEYSVYDPKTGKETKTNPVQSIGEIFNNNPAFLQGEAKDIAGRSVIDVTQSFPGGGLKTGRGSDDTFQSIYYDPNKRVLLVERQDKQKDAKGVKETSLEEIPESKAGQFMARIAGANGVDPNKIGTILSQLGYQNAKFKNVTNPDYANNRMQEEHTAKITEAVKNIDSDSFDNLKGISTKDGVIEDVDNRNILGGWLPGRDRYAIDVKTPDGKKKTVTFKNKDEFKKYIQESGSTKAILD